MTAGSIDESAAQGPAARTHSDDEEDDVDGGVPPHRAAVMSSASELRLAVGTSGSFGLEFGQRAQTREVAAKSEHLNP